MGLLANTDSSILKVDLDHGFKIEDISDDEGVNLISILERLPYKEVSKRLFMDFPCLNLSEKKFYFISKSFEPVDEGWAGTWNTIAEFADNFVRGYLNSVIQLMKLFKEGNICIPLTYYFLIDNNTPKLVVKHDTALYISPKPEYTLENLEIPDLQRFIQNTKLPFKESFLVCV